MAEVTILEISAIIFTLENIKKLFESLREFGFESRLLYLNGLSKCLNIFFTVIVRPRSKTRS